MSFRTVFLRRKRTVGSRLPFPPERQAVPIVAPQPPTPGGRGRTLAHMPSDGTIGALVGKLEDGLGRKGDGLV
jgi:hypothetical protein